MKQFRMILGFELNGFFKNKTFVGVTIFFIIMIAAITSFPRIKASFKTEKVSSDKEVIILSSEVKGMEENLTKMFEKTFPDYEVSYVSDGEEKIQKSIEAGDAKCAFVVHDLTSYTYYVNNLSMYDQNTLKADEVLQNAYRMGELVSSGIADSHAEQILSKQITHNTENLGKDQMQNFFYTYIMIFALYMVILLYGQMVATNVASEKSSRAMELLITSSKPISMMFGKIIASCIAGLTQLVCVFGSALLLFQLNKSYWGGNDIINSIFNIPMDLLLYIALFFVLGFFLYAFMYGAVGSMSSKMEDVNTSVMPITMLFIIAFLVVMFSMGSGNVDNTVMKICSYIPFTSPMAMFTRIAMSTVAPYEIIISVAILIASVLGIGVLSAKIYRVGVLLYGTTPKIGTIIRSVWRA